MYQMYDLHLINRPFLPATPDLPGAFNTDGTDAPRVVHPPRGCRADCLPAQIMHMNANIGTYPDPNRSIRCSSP